LRRQFDSLQYDNGPHSFTRVVLRHRLISMALGDNSGVRAGAIRTLLFMKEGGALLALRDEQGPAGKLAAEAYHRLLNPAMVFGARNFSKEDE
jgi:hypothetical protein